MPKSTSEAGGGLKPAADRAIETLTRKLGYARPVEVPADAGGGLLALEDGRPAVFVYLMEPGKPIDPVQQNLAQQSGAVVENGPAAYVWATNGNADYYFNWLTEVAVSELPARDRWAQEVGAAPRAVTRHRADPAQYKRLQSEFDELHEFIYAARDNVNNANDIIYELCKLIFLKVHLERNRDYVVGAIGGKKLEDVFAARYIQERGAAAVEEIKRAFAEIKELPEYRLKDEEDRSFRIFDTAESIRLNRPETFTRVVQMLTRYQLSLPQDGLEDDLLGRAFDVMLRAKFESKGGMGVYLTPQQVRDAMVEMAFKDIEREDSAAITRRDLRTGRRTFRVGDPACGSGGFLVRGIREVRKYVDRLVGLSDADRAELLREIFAQGFVGADNSPGMVLMARINMVLHGDPEARVFHVDNSLTSDVFQPETFDLILTNPPFKSGGVTETDQAKVLQAFQRDITAEGQCRMTSAGLALGAKPDGKGRWRPVPSIDPAVLFIDRCLQLLKPGGRLVIVVPDGILSNSGDRYVREYLMGKKDEETGRFYGGKAVVKAVVSLPQVTFRLSGAGAKTSFLYLQKKRPGDEQGAIYMAVAEEVGFDVKNNREVVTGRNDLLRIVEVYRQGPVVSSGAAE